MIILKIFCPFGRTFVDKSQIVDRYAGYVCFLFQNISGSDLSILAPLQN